MELFGYDKFIYALNIKNEKTNYHRILTGLLDIHSFYIKKTNTSMCSYVEDWNIYNKYCYNIKLIIERIIIYVIIFINYLKKLLPSDIKENILVKIMVQVISDVFCIILNTYCL